VAKVLIIDDDAAMRRMMSRVLADAGHKVLEAADGRDGVRQFRSETPEIIVTDIVMPEQEGIQTIREIREAGSHVAIIAISGGGGGGDGALYLTIAEELGADAVLQKPFRLAELVAVIDRMLSRDSAAE
jgi:DNA-binding response OmpR family regulator